MATTQTIPGKGFIAALPAHIAAMTQPNFYPDPAAVDFRQTHISYVFLVGNRVFKIKKPVRFAFLDATALDTRRHLCFEEVRLNRRLASDVYIGVRPIIDHASSFTLGDVLQRPQDSIPDSTLDYAVEMRRLPDDRMLDRLIRRGTVGTSEIRAIADRLAAFHRTAGSQSAARYGLAARVSRIVAENLRECERCEGYTLSQSQMDGLVRYSHSFAGDNWKRLNRRAAEGHVRDGHGDLRCEHICLDGDITIFDCVEFSEELRYGDVASDLAFLAMDLDRLGAPRLSQQLADDYATKTGDRDLLLLLPYYKCYRAVVRAKVETLRSLEPEVGLEERNRSRDAARQYFAQACRYAGCYDGRAAVVAVCGPAASGKSTTARFLGQRLGFDVVSSDIVRKSMAGASPTTSLKAPYEKGIYSQEFTSRTYAALAASVDDHLQAGRGVILDATFRHPRERRAVIEQTSKRAAPVLFVECCAPGAEIMRRLKHRAQHRASVSDAGVEVYQRQRADFAPLDEIPSGSRVRIDSTQSPEAAANVIEERLARLCTPASAHERE